MSKTPTIQELFLSFFRLGLTAFGGPAMIVEIRKTAVGKKEWVSETSFRDGVSLCQMVPGATMMQAAAYVGLRSRGIGGGTLLSTVRRLVPTAFLAADHWRSSLSGGRNPQS